MPIKIISINNIKVGKDSYHNGNLQIRGNGKITIGSYCALGKDIKMITTNHNYNYSSIQYSFYKKYFNQKPEIINKDCIEIIIGNDVWIGDNVCVLPGVKIGHGSIIGAGSVVTKNVTPYSIVGGVPAKFIKNRFSGSVKEKLLDSKWWDWSENKIKENKEFFFKNWNDETRE
ncbi:CatB-related O-acetyltransferase [Polaribacter sp. DS7-9]|nr:CatB-related O-acetyltransferase [Polaribacter sp. DS7-9]